MVARFVLLTIVVLLGMGAIIYRLLKPTLKIVLQKCDEADQRAAEQQRTLEEEAALRAQAEQELDNELPLSRSQNP